MIRKNISNYKVIIYGEEWRYFNITDIFSRLQSFSLKPSRLIVLY